MMIKRILQKQLSKLSSQFPAILLTGPRQSGKTTLCKHVFKKKPYVSFEAPDVRRYAKEDPRGFLEQYPQGAILDEIQRVPELPSYLQGVIDEKNTPGLFIMTGSQNFQIMDTLSQSLAGRCAVLKLLPFSLKEISSKYRYEDWREWAYKGFYPRIYDQAMSSTDYYSSYTDLYLERDIRSLINVQNLEAFQVFMGLVAGRMGQLLNLNQLSTEAGISHTTARQWMTVLEASYIVKLLPPYFRNIKKRLVKSHKIYFYDVGLASALLGIQNVDQWKNHPLGGAAFENLIVMEVLKSFTHCGKKAPLFFYRDNHGNEVDLLIEDGVGLLPVEIKSGKTISSDFFKGLNYFRKIYEDKGEVKKGVVVYGGDLKQSRANIDVVSWSKISF